MSSISFKIEGIEELQEKLQKNIQKDAVKRKVKKNGTEMQKKMVRNAESAFVKGYVTGATARSITGKSTDGGLTYEAEPGTHYAPYLEYGTRKMSAQPFVKPAFNAQKGKFKSDMEKLVK